MLIFRTDHWCTRPELYQDTSIDVWLNLSAPELPDGSFDRCNIFDLDYSSGDAQRPENTARTIKCSSWEYDHSFFQVKSKTNIYIYAYFLLFNIFFRTQQLRGMILCVIINRYQGTFKPSSSLVTSLVFFSLEYCQISLEENTHTLVS